MHSLYLHETVFSLLEETRWNYWINKTKNVQNHKLLPNQGIFLKVRVKTLTSCSASHTFSRNFNKDTCRQVTEASLEESQPFFWVVFFKSFDVNHELKSTAHRSILRVYRLHSQTLKRNINLSAFSVDQPILVLEVHYNFKPALQNQS